MTAISNNWPDDKPAAIAFTFDVDAESGFLGEGEAYAKRLTSLSEGRFGVTRGLPRILNLLQRYGVDATFFVPGDTAERHPHAVEAILEHGHEIGHHGHIHLRSDKVSADAQRQEVEKGLDSLQRAGAPRPTGYRSTSWELTPETLDLLLEYDFFYDSSCMGDDRPYRERYEERSIIELPVHWSLDDWPHFGWTIDAGGNVVRPETLLGNWLDEYRRALEDAGRTVIFTMHPEVIGRAYRFPILERLVKTVAEEGTTWIATLDAIARHVETSLPPA
jgi:peptidoglycan-N-acetylglucosamine deacetylase